MPSRLTDTMPIAIAFAMGAIATEFFFTTKPPLELARELKLDDFDYELHPSPRITKDEPIAQSLPPRSPAERSQE